jgi:hypothetical protein
LIGYGKLHQVVSLWPFSSLVETLAAPDFPVSNQDTMETKIQIAKKGQARDWLLCAKDSDLWNAYFKNNP